MNGELVTQQDAAIKVKSVDPAEKGTLAQVGGDLLVGRAKTICVDGITPHIHLDTAMRVQINRDQSVGASDARAENANSNWHVRRIALSSDLATLNNKKNKVDSIGKGGSNKITIVDNVEAQCTLTITGQNH